MSLLAEAARTGASKGAAVEVPEIPPGIAIALTPLRLAPTTSDRRRESRG